MSNQYDDKSGPIEEIQNIEKSLETQSSEEFFCNA